MPEAIDTLVILGAGGDLARRLLLPGVGQVLDAESAAAELRLIGVGQHEMSDADWRSLVADAFADGGADGPRSAAAAASTVFRSLDVTDADALAELFEVCSGATALYFALPPAVTERAIDALSTMDLPEGLVLALEKPFGTDAASAAALNRKLASMVPESQIHRVDHFLGTSTVLNLLGLRFANRIFENSWNRESVESVEIVFDEALALEGRAGYYDRAGALVDMVQSHLLQVLALVAMEPPSSVGAEDLRGAMSQALLATQVAGDDPVAASVRARYTAGAIGDRHLPAYADEDGVDASRETETFAQLTLDVDTWRWSGVPFTLRSGKALGDARQEIILTFRAVPRLPAGLRGGGSPSRIRIALSPERVDVDVQMNGAGDPFELDPVTLGAEFGGGGLGPYGEVIAGILASDPTLSIRGDVVEQCWRIVDPVRESWARGEVPLGEYPAGSSARDVVASLA